VTVDRVGNKKAQTSKTEVLPDTCCVVSAYIQPPFYLPIPKHVYNESKQHYTYF